MAKSDQDQGKQRADVQYKAVVGNDAATGRTTVKQADNHVYFYSDVSGEQCLELVQAVREVDIKLRTEQIGRNLNGVEPTPIWLHVHSYGGELFAGLGTADQLSQIKSPIYAIIEGVCASAATLLALSCEKTYITPSSFMLIHQLSSFAWGTHEDFKDEMHVQRRLMDQLIRFYAKHTKLKKKKIRKMLRHDFWMDAEKCVELGFVDAIMR